MIKPLFTGRIPVQSETQTFFKVDLYKDVRIDIRLIDSGNIFNIYVCTITEGDFSVTKREQGIKVDFESFTKIIIQFFIDVQEGRMLATFSRLDERSKGVFKFVFLENNMFRNVVRLELLYYKPDEREFKRYLSDVIGRFEEDNVKLIKENFSLKENLRLKENDFESIKRDLKEEIEELRMKKERFYKENCILEEESFKKAEKLKKFEEIKMDLTNLKEDFEKERMKNKSLENKNESLKRQLEDYKNNFNKIEEEFNEHNDELRKMKLELKRNNKDLDERSNELEIKNKTVMKLQRELEDKNERLGYLENKTNNLKMILKEKDTLIHNINNENKKLKNEHEEALLAHDKIRNLHRKENNDASISDSFSFIQPESPLKKNK